MTRLMRSRRHWGVALAALLGLAALPAAAQEWPTRLIRLVVP